MVIQSSKEQNPELKWLDILPKSFPPFQGSDFDDGDTAGDTGLLCQEASAYQSRSREAERGSGRGCCVCGSHSLSVFGVREQPRALLLLLLQLPHGVACKLAPLRWGSTSAHREVGGLGTTRDPCRFLFSFVGFGLVSFSLFSPHVHSPFFNCLSPELQIPTSDTETINNSFKKYM